MLIRARGSRLRYRRHTGVAVSGAHSGDVGYLFRLMSVRMAERRLVGCDFSITHPMGSSGDGLRSLLLAQTVYLAVLLDLHTRNIPARAYRRCPRLHPKTRRP